MGHPTDADREALAGPVLARYADALVAGDAAALAACYAEAAILLHDGGRLDGGDAAARHHAAVAERLPGLASRRVTRRQQQGAHAVVGWVGHAADGSPCGTGLSTLEIRRGGIVFEALREDPAAAR